MFTQMKNERGVVLIVCLAILFMLSLIGIASITTSNTDMQIADNEYRTTGAFYAAESGLERAASIIKNSYESAGVPPDPLPSDTTSELNYIYTFNTIDEGPAQNTQLNTGAYEGLFGLVKTFTISSIGVDNNSTAGVELQMQVQDALIPLFQFAIFYENDLEIGPGPDMTISGRVHTNSDMYLVTGSDLYFDSYLTAAGNVFHGIGGVVNNNDIWIQDENGVYQTMQNGDGTFLDSDDADWVNQSLSRWDGHVEDNNHGITELDMQVVTDGEPTDLIDRYDGGNNPSSYENMAGLKFIDGQAFYLQPDNSWLNVTATFLGDAIITPSVFYDAREGRDVVSIDLDIDKLNASGYFPSNGIIYSSMPQGFAHMTAIRLTNGQQLAGPLTVATDNPLYTLGDYNTVNKQPASLLTDAMTILSNNWDDSRSALGLGTRVAAATQVNASYMTGNTESISDGESYNGGFENLPRFLEDWGGITFTWTGSATDLWHSRQANSQWSSSYFRAPDRNWSFDTDLLDPTKLPPGTPTVNIVQRLNWSQKIYRSTDLAEGS